MKNKETDLEAREGGVYEKWTRRFIGRYGWLAGRATVVDETDLYQEAWMIYTRVCSRYPHVNRSMRMRIYTTSLWRHFERMGKVRSREIPISRDRLPMGASPPTEIHDSIRALLDEAPPLVRRLVRSLRLYDGRGSHYRLPLKARSSRDAWNRHMCRRLKISPRDVDLAGLVEMWLGWRWLPARPA
jgi:hypothetical protein